MRVHVVLHSAGTAIVVPVSNGTTIESLAKLIAARAKVDQVELFAAGGAQLYSQDNAAEVLAHDEKIVAFDDPIQARQRATNVSYWLLKCFRTQTLTKSHHLAIYGKVHHLHSTRVC